MAASVNNIAATFASSARTSSSASALSNTTSSSTSLASCSSSTVASVSWNPQMKAKAYLRTSFVGLYGGPGPIRRLAVAPRKALDLEPARQGLSPAMLHVRASIGVGDRLPEAELSYFDKDGEIQTVKVSELTKGKKVVLFAVPGAFTPTCSQQHVPGFIEKAGELRAKGVDAIACISVNDVFVMKAWGESMGVKDEVLLLSDGNGHFTRAMAVSLDLSDRPQGLGVRSRRYALLAEDGIVTLFNLEEGGAFTVSGADDILNAL